MKHNYKCYAALFCLLTATHNSIASEEKTSPCKKRSSMPLAYVINKYYLHNPHFDDDAYEHIPKKKTTKKTFVDLEPTISSHSQDKL